MDKLQFRTALKDATPDIADQLSDAQLDALLLIGKERELRVAELRNVLDRAKGKERIKWGEKGNEKMKAMCSIVNDVRAKAERVRALPQLISNQYEQLLLDDGASEKLFAQLRSTCGEVDPEKAARMPHDISSDIKMRSLDQYLNYHFLVPNYKFCTRENSRNQKVRTGTFTLLQSEDFPHPSCEGSATMWTVSSYRTHASTLGNRGLVCPPIFLSRAQESFKGLKGYAPNSPMLMEALRVWSQGGKPFDKYYEVDSEHAFEEELSHCFDAMFIAQQENTHPIEISPTIQSGLLLCKAGAPLEKLAEEERVRLCQQYPEEDAQFGVHRAMIELSGQTLAAIRLMQKAITGGNYDKAWSMFLLHMEETMNFRKNYAGGSVDAYAIAASWLLSERTQDDLALDKELLEQCTGKSDHPAERGLALLEQLHYANFLTIEEQKQKLSSGGPGGS